MEEFIDMLFREQLGRNIAVPLEQVTRAGLRQWRKVEEKEPVIDDLTTLFCSKTVAVVYKSVGIIDHRRDASDFLPKHLTWLYADILDLKLGAALGPEIRVTFESAAMRTAVSALLAISGIDYLSGQSRQRHAALAIQMAARRAAATRVRERRRQELGLHLGPIGRGIKRLNDTRQAMSMPEMLRNSTGAIESPAAASPPSATRKSPKGTPAREERASLLRQVSSSSKAFRPRATSLFASSPELAGDPKRDALVDIADKALDEVADEALGKKRLPGKHPDAAGEGSTATSRNPLAAALGSMRSLAFGASARDLKSGHGATAA